MEIVEGKRYKLGTDTVKVLEVGIVDETWDVPEIIPDGTRMVIVQFTDGKTEAWDLQYFITVVQEEFGSSQ